MVHTTRFFQQSKAGIIVSILNQSYLPHIIIKDYLISKGNKKLFLKDYTDIIETLILPTGKQYKLKFTFLIFISVLDLFRIFTEPIINSAFQISCLPCPTYSLPE